MPALSRAACLVLLLLTSCASAPVTEQDTPSALGHPAVIAITGVTVVDGTGAPARQDQTVIVSGNRIAAVGPASLVPVPPGAQVVDGRDRYLIPGLWDMHAHITSLGPEGLGLYLAHGITGIRDMGADEFATARDWRDGIADGTLLGPRMRIASPVVEHPRWLVAVQSMAAQAGLTWLEPALRERFGPETADQAVVWVDSIAAMGADHVKVRNFPEEAVARALVARALERGLPVVSHAMPLALELPVASVEHSFFPPLQLPAEDRAELYRRLAARGTAVVPTLVAWEGRELSGEALLARTEAERGSRFRHVTDEIIERWRQEAMMRDQETPMDWEAMHLEHREQVAEMHAAGVVLMPGSDVGAPLVVPGASVHDELVRLAAATGMTPLEAIQAATLRPAQFLSMAESLGTVEVGKTADLVLLDADPLADLGNTLRIRAVIADGRLLDRAELDRMLAEASAH